MQKVQILSKLEKHYDALIWDHADLVALYAQDNNADLNVKKTARWFLENRIGFLQPHYYIEQLLKVDPKNIADIGCGSNDFKRFYPNIIGYDPVEPEADFKESFDEKFVQRHFQEFDVAFSICALHFIPLDYFAQRVSEFASVIKPGGRGYLSLNLARMVEDTPNKKNTDYLLDLFGTENPSTEQCYDYITKELDTIALDMLEYDVDFKIYDTYYNGNIRLLFNV